MKTYYVSLTRDLIGCYLEFQAESEHALRHYLEHEYLVNGIWTLPWCAVYKDIPTGGALGEAIIIKTPWTNPIYEVADGPAA